MGGWGGMQQNIIIKYFFGLCFVEFPFLCSCFIFYAKDYTFLFMFTTVAEDDVIPSIPKKELPKNAWDEEDVEESDVKDSWEDEDEPAPV